MPVIISLTSGYSLTHSSGGPASGVHRPTALATAVKELNIRESLVWSNMKISNEGYTTDEDVFAALDKGLGPKLKWNPGPTIGGGTLHCESQSIALTRIASTNSAAGKWH